MNTAIDVLVSVIDDSVFVVCRQSVVGLQLITEDTGASLDMLVDLRMQGGTFPVFKNGRLGLSPTFEHSEDNSPVLVTGPGGLFCARLSLCMLRALPLR